MNCLRRMLLYLVHELCGDVCFSLEIPLLLGRAISTQTCSGVLLEGILETHMPFHKHVFTFPDTRMGRIDRGELH